MLEIGSLIDGKYKVLNVIGQGGMSVVYLVINEKANKSWALKEIRKDGIKDFEVVKQGLVVETDMLKKLRHAYLPSIVDIIEDDERFLIVMDYIEGNPLSWYIGEYGAQSQENVIFWAKQLCDVLSYLHSRQPPIIYRDMKPANIMLKPDGNIVLIDFGTAREFKEKNLADTTCLGTVGYAAPEQFGGQGQTDERTDIYCLGASLYHLLTGCNPCEPPYEILPVRQINPALSGGLEKIILKCTQRNPKDRFQSCEELLYALEHYEIIDDRYRKKQKRKLAVFFASTLLSVLLLGTGAVTNSIAMENADANYENLIEQAKKEMDIKEKEVLYKKAIGLKPEDSKAYLEYINSLKEDADFSQEEEKEYISIIKNNQVVLKQNAVEYSNICFETGKLYWYYYHSSNTVENRTGRMKPAVNWFSDAIDYGGDGFAYRNMASVYKEIGMFYRDIPSKAIEGEDKGVYGQFFKELKALMNLLEKEKDNSEIVLLELCELSRYSMMQYAGKFKSDGVTKEEMEKMYNRTNEKLSGIKPTTEKTTEMKSEIAGLMEETKKTIELVYRNE